MNKSETISKIQSCYEQYCGIIKPLIAQIEASSEKMPLPLLNEIRAFNDHVARCYYGNPSEEYIEEQVDKAVRHIVRMTLDCFKCLNVIQYQKIETFESHTRNVDLTVIDNGLFYPEYSRLKVEAERKVKDAKIAEASNLDEALNLFQESYNLYSRITELIDSVREKTKWAKVRFTTRRWLTIIGWIVSVLISAVVSAIFSCEIISSILSH